MKPVFILFFLLAQFNLSLSAQNITYSEPGRKDNSNINFDIIGKLKGQVLVYKNIARQHYLSRYNEEMKMLDEQLLDFLPEKVFNLDFITYPDYFIVVYQYQRGSIVYCKSVRIEADGSRPAEPRLLDTTGIGFFADNKIYAASFSEDKQRILVHKRNIRNGYLSIVTKLYNADMDILDSTRQLVEHDMTKEIYSDVVVDNKGNFIFTRETSRRTGDNAGSLEYFIHYAGTETFLVFTLPLENNFIDDVSIKADNLNKKFILNSFYFSSRRGNVTGLFTALVDTYNPALTKIAFNPFSDSLRNKLNSSDRYKFVFDNLVIRNIVVKKNGGFVIAAEDFYSENLGANNLWNRNFYNLMPYSNLSNYYLYNPYAFGYRPLNNFGNFQSIRYNYNDVLIASVDSSMKLVWNNLIRKRQMDVDNDNFMSYSIFNSGGQVKFFYIDRDRQRQIINCQGVYPDGSVKRYPTIVSTEKRCEFMPRLAKQVSASQLIMPFVYLGKIGFAKIDF